MTPLETRKHLLITESELTRVQLAEDWNELLGEASRWRNQAQPLISAVVYAAGLTGTFQHLYRRLPPAASRNGKVSWFARALRGVQTGAALWQVLRLRRAGSR